jgi:acyl-CoA oxidase
VKVSSGDRPTNGGLNGLGASALLGEATAQPTMRALAAPMHGAEDSFTRRLVEALHDPIFDASDHLTASEQCTLAYARMRFLRRVLDLRARDLLQDPHRLLALHAWTSIVDGTLTTLLTIHYNLCIGSIVQHGNDRPELAPVLAELDDMESVGVFLATELAYGNNVQALQTTAHYDREHDEFVLHTPSREAQKFMPNTGAHDVPKIAVVMARLHVDTVDCGVFPFIVRIRTSEGLCEGVHVTALSSKPDYALDNAVTSFHHVRIPRANWLHGVHSNIGANGRFQSTIRSRRTRFLNAMDRVQTGKLCLSAAAAAGTSAALQLTVSYAAQRRTFSLTGREVSILSYSTYQRAMSEAVATNYACWLLVRHAQVMMQAQTDAVLTNRTLALCKVFVSSRSLDVLGCCREKVGAQGMFSRNRIISYLLHTNAIVTAEGDNEVLTIKSARELVLGASYTLPEPETVRESVPLLQSTDYLIALLRGHERALVLRLRSVLVGTPDNVAKFDAWNDHLVEACELARAHAARIALERFEPLLENLEDEHARVIVERLMRTFALQEISKCAAALIGEGLLSIELARQIERERASLARALGPDLSLITQASAVPSALLRAPIADDYLDAYDYFSREHTTHSSGVRQLVGPGPASARSSREPDIKSA